MCLLAILPVVVFGDQSEHEIVTKRSVFEVMEYCTALSADYTMLATVALNGKEDDKPKFDAFVEKQADAIATANADESDSDSHDHIKQRVMQMGAEAWDNSRKHVSPVIEAMHRYHICIDAAATHA